MQTCAREVGHREREREGDRERTREREAGRLGVHLPVFVQMGAPLPVFVQMDAHLPVFVQMGAHLPVAVQLGCRMSCRRAALSTRRFLVCVTGCALGFPTSQSCVWAYS